eukprot:CAMPEP_0174745652 /NCGR_PEP_ID=MMETSP1094-20130205/87285_1 /TAXON_ID=156173 /ORGANISM="Chrysochromulina brevifilum, Strain UTEX LB 985" /LENGTH=59 /DNA_ID=CAMNT_0015950227 /DNA_START=476 /DNA_END=652 /DNA_ORIENTATION=+
MNIKPLRPSNARPPPTQSGPCRSSLSISGAVHVTTQRMSRRNACHDATQATSLAVAPEG